MLVQIREARDLGMVSGLLDRLVALLELLFGGEVAPEEVDRILALEEA